MGETVFWVEGLNGIKVWKCDRVWFREWILWLEGLEGVRVVGFEVGRIN